MPYSSPDKGQDRSASEPGDVAQNSQHQAPPHPAPPGFDGSFVSNATIGIAADVPALALVPTNDEITRYRGEAAAFLAAERISLDQMKLALRSALELRERLDGGNSGGAITIVETRMGWARQAYETQAALVDWCKGLYANSPEVVLFAVVTDFIQRLENRGVILACAHSASLVSAALEQTRLMVVFAGRALKSEDHAQSAIAGIQERSFTGLKRTPSGTDEKTGDARQAAFEQRQAAKAAASAAKRAALKAGGTLPVSGTEQKPKQDEEKAGLLAATAAQHRAQFDTARPSEELRAKLRLRDPQEIRSLIAARARGGTYAVSPDEIEKTRVELVNNFANRFKDWLALEVQLGGALGIERLSLAEFPLHSGPLQMRYEELQKLRAELQELQCSTTEVLTRAAKAVMALSAQEQQVFSPRELEQLRSIIAPEAPREIYGILPD